jgi:hypothetical protein
VHGRANNISRAARSTARSEAGTPGFSGRTRTGLLCNPGVDGRHKSASPRRCRAELFRVGQRTKSPTPAMPAAFCPAIKPAAHTRESVGEVPARGMLVRSRTIGSRPVLVRHPTSPCAHRQASMRHVWGQGKAAGVASRRLCCESRPLCGDYSNFRS